MGGLAILSGYLVSADYIVRLIFWAVCYCVGAGTGLLLKRGKRK